MGVPKVKVRLWQALCSINFARFYDLRGIRWGLHGRWSTCTAPPPWRKSFIPARCPALRMLAVAMAWLVRPGAAAPCDILGAASPATPCECHRAGSVLPRPRVPDPAHLRPEPARQPPRRGTKRRASSIIRTASICDALAVNASAAPFLLNGPVHHKLTLNTSLPSKHVSDQALSPRRLPSVKSKKMV